eukprot:2589254-Prymnesium_polylepis.2
MVFVMSHCCGPFHPRADLAQASPCAEAKEAALHNQLEQAESERRRKEAAGLARSARAERYAGDEEEDEYQVGRGGEGREGRKGCPHTEAACPHTEAACPHTAAHCACLQAELGQFIVTEDCPRCGKQFSTGHVAHLRACKGKSGGKSKEVVKDGGKRKSFESFVVGKYADGDKAYREPKQPKGGTKGSSSKGGAGSASKKGSGGSKGGGKAPPKKQKPPAPKKAPSKGASNKKKRKRDDSEDDDSDWSP